MKLLKIIHFQTLIVFEGNAWKVRFDKLLCIEHVLQNFQLIVQIVTFLTQCIRTFAYDKIYIVEITQTFLLYNWCFNVCFVVQFLRLLCFAGFFVHLYWQIRYVLSFAYHTSIIAQRPRACSRSTTIAKPSNALNVIKLYTVGYGQRQYAYVGTFLTSGRHIIKCYKNGKALWTFRPSPTRYNSSSLVASPIKITWKLQWWHNGSVCKNICRYGRCSWPV